MHVSGRASSFLPRSTWPLRSGAVAMALLGSAMATSVQAMEPQSMTVYVEAGQSAKTDGRDTGAATLGPRIPTQTSFWGGSISLAWDVYLSEWKTDAFNGSRSHFTEVGVVPMLRYRFGGGQSPWFVDGGIGVSYMDGKYTRGNQEFSTQWNFSDHLGVGRNFGADQRHELGVYVKHVSNGGFKKPNPGETLYQLRYGYRF
ncbi:MAG: hypothetical protein JWQ88_3301 [Rhodoferax sp.]|nr:hypothetical protein [Rhodoferax sp.]